MSAKRPSQKFKTAATTFCVALGIGFVMQYGDAMASRWGDDRPVSGPSSINAITTEGLEVTPVRASSVVLPQTFVIPTASKSDVSLASTTAVPLETETPTFAALSAPEADALPDAIEEDPIVAIAAAETPEITIDALPEPIAAAPACTQTLNAEAAGFAMVALTYEGTCDALAAVTILHEDMMFEVIADANGRFEMDVPALSEEALFGVEAANGETVFSIISVAEIAMYDRVALQWQGRSDVQLHALEFGAAYGGAGHIWAASAGDRIDAASGNSGFLTRLGTGTATDGFFADVYTYPTGLSALDGEIALSVEAEVTAMNCGREIKAQTMQVNPSDRPTTHSLTMTMPGCDAIGEFLVLNNMFEDLTLASR